MIGVAYDISLKQLRHIARLLTVQSFSGLKACTTFVG